MGSEALSHASILRPQSATEQSAYDKWLEQTSAREEARRDRVHGAVGVIPIQLWIVLFFIAGVIFVFMLFFADRGERAVVQGMLIGSVVSVITVLLLLLNGLNSPYHDGVGGLQPVAMERSLRHDRRGAERGRRRGGAPATRSGLRRPRECRERRSRPGRARSNGAPRPGNGRHCVERIPVDPMERGAGEGGCAPNALRIESAKFAGLANTQTVVDASVFTDWVNAYAENKTELADFYFTRFRKEFKPAVDAWIATRPLENPNAPPTPFAMPQYKLEARDESERLSAEAELFAAEARRDIQRASNYVLGVVLFASSLFFAGMSAKLASPQTARRDALHRLHGLPLTAVWIATSPVPTRTWAGRRSGAGTTHGTGAAADTSRMRGRRAQA